MNFYYRRSALQTVNTCPIRVVRWILNLAGSNVSWYVTPLQAVQNVVSFKSFTVGIPTGVSYVTSTGVTVQWFPTFGGSNALRKQNARLASDNRWGI